MSESRAILSNFLESVKDDLGMVVLDYKLFAPRYLFFLEDDVRHAWADLGSDFERAHAEMREVDTQTLRKHGLAGPQLKLKINAWSKLREVAKRLWVELKSTRRRISASVVHLLFDAAQTILKSLGFIPGVDAIEEFKSVLESIADGSKQIWKRFL